MTWKESTSMMIPTTVVSWRLFLSLAAVASVLELSVVLFQTSQLHQENLAAELALLRPTETAFGTQSLSSDLTVKTTLGSSTVRSHGLNARFHKPRMLIGILADSQTEESQDMRNRFREVFKVWNDTRVCTLNEFAAKNFDENEFILEERHAEDTTYDCHVVYTFVLSAYSRNATLPYFAKDTENIPTVRLYDTLKEPLVLDEVPGFDMQLVSDDNEPPFLDILEHQDGIFLNIAENMNEGKTSTFLYWASKVSRQYKIPFVAKCDTDAVLRLHKLLQFLHHELPKTPVNIATTPVPIRPPSIVAGAMRHKPWKGGFLPTVDESYWQTEFFHGMHLYLNGGFYLMSQHLAELAVQEARALEQIIPNVKMDLPPGEYNDPHAYLEGAEDHDAIAMAEQGLMKSDKYKGSILQWMVMPKNLRFFSHPVKNHKKWERFVQSEEDRIRSFPNFQISPDTPDIQKPDVVKTLLVIFNATSASTREEYRSELHDQGYHICNALEKQASPSTCDMYYFFVLGEGKADDPSKKLPSTLSYKVAKRDVLFLADVENENQMRMGLQTLSFIHNHLGSEVNSTEFALTIFSQATQMVDIKKWNGNIVSSVERSLRLQSTQHLMIGDVRDKTKGRKQREFSEFCEYDFFRFQHDAVQLYLGSECFAFSSNMIPLWLKQAADPSSGACQVGHIGHDLTYLAYKTSDTILHWMPVPKSRRFWQPVDMGSPTWEADLISGAMISGNASSTDLDTSTDPASLTQLEPEFADPESKEYSEMFFRPRILIAIVTDRLFMDAQTLRNRHRQLFKLWNDPRVCTLKEFRSRQWEESSFFVKDMPGDLSYHCQIVYSFVLAAHTANGGSGQFKSNATTLRLYDTPEQPLVLKTIPLAPGADRHSFPFSDVIDEGDGTFLNIVENMNQGKTATWLYWASEVTRQWNIPYVAKCDSDSFLNLTGILNFLHEDLPLIPRTGFGEDVKKPSVLAGSPMLRKQRDRDWWLGSTDESFWEKEYFMGSHLYYNGGFYLMSRDMAEASTSESRRLEHFILRIVNHETRRKEKMKLEEDEPHEYLEGTEDIDAFSTAEQGHYKAIIRAGFARKPSVTQWIDIPHESCFHEHPIKVRNKLKWKAHWERQKRYQRTLRSPARKRLSRPSVPQSTDVKSIHSLLLVYGATTHADREKYRAGLYSQGRGVCTGHQAYGRSLHNATSNCGIHYLFIVGREGDGKDVPTENLHNASSLEWRDPNSAYRENGDVLSLNVQASNLEGLALSALFYIQEHLQGHEWGKNFDVVMFSKASKMVNIQLWMENVLSSAQFSLGVHHQKHLLIGDVRDKGRNKREFIDSKCQNPLGAFKYHKHYSPHQMQLYLGSDCFAISSSLVPHWLEQARNPQVGRCTEGHLGHDLSYLSHFDGAILQWTRIPKTLQFWQDL